MRHLTPILLLMIMLGGCARPAGVIFQPLERPLVWPAPPEPPRIAYVGQLATSDDLKPPRPALEGLGRALFGRKPTHAMVSPFAVCTDGADRLFVADNGARVVHVMDLRTRRYTQLRPPRKARQFEQLVGIAHDPSGRVLITDSAAGVIFVFDTAGRYRGELGEGILQRPCGITVQAGTGRIFIADVAAHQVVILSPDGQLVQRLGQRGAGPGQFNYPTNLTLDSQGRLYVSDSMNFRVQQFSDALQPLRVIGSQGDRPGFFGQPRGVTVDGEDHLYVMDSRFENVQIFDPEGRLLLFFGGEGTGPGQFWLPSGIFIDANNRIWIADSYNQRVVVLDYLPEKGS
jgi:DNA-binding beta-propeller fold protein YncE